MIGCGAERSVEPEGTLPPVAPLLDEVAVAEFSASEALHDWTEDRIAGLSRGMAEVCIDEFGIEGELSRLDEATLSESFQRTRRLPKENLSRRAVSDFCDELAQ